MRKKVGGRQVPGHTVGMTKKSPRPPTRSKLSVLRQLCHHIPPHLVAQLARDLGTEKLARTCSHWSHVVALLYAQLVHAISLNDVCDSLRLHSGPLSALRGAKPPSKNGLSHANKERDPALAEALFWKMLSAPARSLSGAGRTRGPPVGRTLHPERLRRVVALVEVDGKEVEMTFLTNHLEWAAASVVALYKCRWQIEVFFKQIKQTLQLADFLGNSARAVRWQVWTALLVYVLLRLSGGGEPVGPQLRAAVGGDAGGAVAAAGMWGRCSKAMGQRAGASGCWARPNRRICRAWGEPVGQPTARTGRAQPCAMKNS